MDGFSMKLRAAIPEGIVTKTLLIEVLQTVDPTAWNEEKTALLFQALPDPVTIETLVGFIFGDSDSPETAKAGNAKESAKKREAAATAVPPAMHRLRDGEECSVHFLKEMQHLTKELAQYCFTEFEEAYKDLGLCSVEEAVKDFQDYYMNDDCVPFVLVCVSSAGKLLGTVTLEDEDMSTRQDLTPWVADFFTVPEERKRGVGSIMMKELLRLTGSLGLPRLYLWTEHEEGYFSKVGFKRLVPERVEYAGAEVSLMYMDLQTVPATPPREAPSIEKDSTRKGTSVWLRTRTHALTMRQRVKSRFDAAIAVCRMSS